MKGEGEPKLPFDLNERSRIIGAALRRARRRNTMSIRQCAKLLGTSPRRYTAIEQGTVYIGAPELQAMTILLRIPSHEVWPEPAPEANKRQVIVEALPGESIQIMVNVAAGPAEEATSQ